MNARIHTTITSQTPWQGAGSTCVRSSEPVSAVIAAVSSEKKQSMRGSRPVRPMNARSAFAVRGFAGGCRDKQEGDPRTAVW